MQKLLTLLTACTILALLSSAYAEQATPLGPQPPTASQANASTTSPSTGFAGDWNTSFGKMKLEVSGDSVRGTYQMGADLCQVEGKISGQEMVFNYTEPSAKGKGRFTLSSDGLSFSGKWLQDGSNQWQQWEGRRPSEAASKQDTSSSKRAWGPEQATGAPDTAAAGDFQTAWASLLPDGGPEWLEVEFPKSVVIGEVRIRETFNPGAISKITAFLNSREEVLLWEGEANAMPAPADMAVKPNSGILSNRIKIYLDTTRVQGWNEIDAVELIGEDGSRQWATNAKASSFYGNQENSPQELVHPDSSSASVTILRDFDATLKPGVWHVSSLGPTEMDCAYFAKVTPHADETKSALIEKVVFQSEYNGTAWNDVLRILTPANQDRDLRVHVRVFKVSKSVENFDQNLAVVKPHKIFTTRLDPGVWHGWALGPTRRDVGYLVKVTPDPSATKLPTLIEKMQVQSEYDGNSWRDVLRIVAPITQPYVSVKVTVFQVAPRQAGDELKPFARISQIRSMNATFSPGEWHSYPIGIASENNAYISKITPLPSETSAQQLEKIAFQSEWNQTVWNDVLKVQLPASSSPWLGHISVFEVQAAGNIAPANATKQGTSTSKRAWGPEQATGAPDTATAGDFQTAWASLLPDSGPEWLEVEFPKPVEIGEVRIRETFNPGAISKITAFLNSREEVLLWEGEANAMPAPADMVVKPDHRVQSNRIKISLDSRRVQGWNEIDAVELVGIDGSRQWASSATASSTYAEKAVAPAPQISNASQANASTPSSSTGFVGDWNTSFGKMKLEVSGDSVRGTYQMGPELCQVEGKISGQEMVFNYTERSATGKGKFTLAPDGISFSGAWLQDGSDKWQPWEGRRPSEALSKPWNNLEELVGTELMDVNGNKVDVKSLQGKIIGLYFSAHWCRPCRDFTPKLVEFRNANTKDFEVIFVSSDRSAADQQKYMQESGMNWPAVPYQSEWKAILKERFSIRGIPALIIVDGKGNLISAQGRSEVDANSTTTLAKWKNLSPNR